MFLFYQLMMVFLKLKQHLEILILVEKILTTEWLIISLMSLKGNTKRISLATRELSED